MKNQDNLAFEIATKFHAGMKYGEHDYMYHLNGVANLVRDFYDSRLTQISYLHDILEDTDLTEETLRALFDDDVCNAVVALTHKEGETREVYLERVLSNNLAACVKRFDMLFNLTESMKRNDTKRIKKYTTQLKYLIDNAK